MSSKKEQQTHGSGVIYTMASDFVHPSQVDKDAISLPVAAKPMGEVDVTANDCVYSNSSPSLKEMHDLEKHAKQTAHALGTKPKKVLRETRG
ncbi:hypothetical protein COEREDRAFT_78836, partial [Coemansia reversa NRRL 1564]